MDGHLDNCTGEFKSPVSQVQSCHFVSWDCRKATLKSYGKDFGNFGFWETDKTKSLPNFLARALIHLNTCIMILPENHELVRSGSNVISGELTLLFALFTYREVVRIAKNPNVCLMTLRALVEDVRRRSYSPASTHSYGLAETRNRQWEPKQSIGFHWHIGEQLLSKLRFRS